MDDYDEAEQAEIGFRILENQLYSALNEFKKLGKMHHAMLVMAQVLAPEWCDISVFMHPTNPDGGPK
tara:strand:- start:169 stop:369 length:201 start_codon:yes stop_codon:yes gene_type:complete